MKLAECQETILNLGKQLKVLASPQDAALFDKVFSNTGAATTVINNKRMNKRFSLHDRMIAEARAEVFKSPNIQGTLSIEEVENSSLPHSNNCKNLLASCVPVHTSEANLGSKNEGTNTGVMALAIVPSKKQGVGLLRRLLWRRKNGYSKKSRY